MDKCPEIVNKGDAEENLDYCKLTNRVCLLVSGDKCLEWEMIQEEE